MGISTELDGTATETMGFLHFRQLADYHGLPPPEERAALYVSSCNLAPKLNELSWDIESTAVLRSDLYFSLP